MEVTSEKIKFFQDSILDWYEENGRKFPWRNKSASNYVRIISETLLQRTKAETVANYFQIFIAQYPSWNKLASATQADLEKILKPLGLYKQRASRLYKLAQEMKKRRGRFPTDRNQVAEMSMMGQYITNAYEIFVLKRRAPLLDVNMARVLERYFGPRKLADIRYDRYLQDLSKRVVDHPRVKEINWGTLDFASAVCKSRAPTCADCIFRLRCTYLSLNH